LLSIEDLYLFANVLSRDLPFGVRRTGSRILVFLRSSRLGFRPPSFFSLVLSECGVEWLSLFFLAQEFFHSSSPPRCRSFDAAFHRRGCFLFPFSSLFLSSLFNPAQCFMAFARSLLSALSAALVVSNHCFFPFLFSG